MNGFGGGIIGGAVVRLFLDSSQFNAAWKQSEANAKISASKMEGTYSRMGVAANAAFMLAQAAVVAFIAQGVKAALEYEKAFQRINAISNTTAENIAAWKDAVVGISNDTARPVNELADALYFLSSSGLDAAQIMPTLESSAKAAAVGLGTTADVARITSQALNAYAATGLTAAEVTDTLVAAVREGSADPEEFAGALGRILPAASAAGIGFDEVTASLAALSNIGLDVNEGVTAMRGLFLALIAPTAKSAEAMADLGISTEEMRSVLKDGGVIAALDLLERKTGGNLDTMKKIIPNVRALTGALGLTGQEAQKVSQIFIATMDSTGALAKAMDDTAQGPAFQLEQSMNQLKNAGMEVGSKLVPALVALGKIVGVVADNFQTLLGILLLYKGVMGLPLLFQSMALAVAGMGPAGAAAAAGLTTASGAAVGLGAALQKSMPWLLAITAAYMTIKALMGAPTRTERLAANVEDSMARVKSVAADAQAVNAEIDAAEARYRAELAQGNGRMGASGPYGSGGLTPLTKEQERQVQLYRYGLRAAANEAMDAAEIAGMSLEEFSQTSGRSLQSLRPLASLLGKSFGEMATEIKTAMGDSDDAEAAWSKLSSAYFADAQKAIQDWRDEATSSLNFVDDAFVELASNGEGSMSKIISTLKKSLEAQVKFNDNLTIVADRARKYGVDASFILQTFIDQGPAAADTVAAFANSSKEAFLDVIAVQKDAGRNASTAARSVQDQVVGTLESIRDILADIARHWGIRVDVEVRDEQLLDLVARLQGLGINTSLSYQIAKNQLREGLATGGVIAAANGIVSRPTYLVGEGGYPTAFGTGAELVQPLNARTLERLGSAIGAYTVKVQGGTSGGNTTIVNVDAAISPMDVAQNIEWWRRTSGR